MRYFNINRVEYGNRTCCEKKDKKQWICAKTEMRGIYGRSDFKDRKWNKEI